MRGPLVTNWVKQKTTEVEDMLQAGADPNNNIFWTSFKTAFEEAYTDTGKAQSTFNEITTLQMKGQNLNEYITRFETLAS